MQFDSIPNYFLHTQYGININKYGVLYVNEYLWYETIFHKVLIVSYCRVTDTKTNNFNLQ
jgi:hypothetical protein